MERPRIIFHILQSMDGNIDGNFFSAPETMPVLREYSRIRAGYNCDAVISGATTAAEIYTDGFVSNLPAASEFVTRTDYQATKADRYAVVIDGTGTVNWQKGTVERKGQQMHVITVLQENVADAYLAQLQKAGVSYIFAGKNKLDLRLAVQKLKVQYGIQTMLLAGGGIVDWAFLQAGLIDELSLVIPPVVDGGIGLATAFDESPFCQGAPASFALKDVQKLPGDGVWLRYTRKE